MFFLLFVKNYTVILKGFIYNIESTVLEKLLLLDNSL